MEDRVVANTLELATSSDFNAAQAMQSRRLSQYLAYRNERTSPPAQGGSDEYFDLSQRLPEALVTGLHIYHAEGSSGIWATAGTLTQESGPWVSVSDPTTTFVTGFQRADTHISFPSTAGLGLQSAARNAWHLLCARVHEVVTLTDTVNIFDVPSQQFVPTAETKRTELQIQWKWVLGAAHSGDATIIPTLNAGWTSQYQRDWEPIAYVMFVDGGDNLGQVIDVANRIDGRAGWESPGYENGLNSFLSLGAPMSARVSSAMSPDCGNALDGSLVGVANGQVNGQGTFLAISQDKQQAGVLLATDGNTLSDWQLVHFYLAPLVCPVMTRWPIHSCQSSNDPYHSEAMRGILVCSISQPSRARTNLVSFGLHDPENGNSSGKWGAQSYVPAGAAQYVGSGHSKNGTTVIYPMVQSGGGSVLYPLGDVYYYAYTDEIREKPGAKKVASQGQLSGLSMASPINVAMDLDLRGEIPYIATEIILYVRVLAQTVGQQINFEVRNKVVDSAHTIGGVPYSASHYMGSKLAEGHLVASGNPPGGSDDWGFPGVEIRVPVGWVPSLFHQDSTAKDYHLNLIIRIFTRENAASSYLGAIDVRLLGWSI